MTFGVRKFLREIPVKTLRAYFESKSAPVPAEWWKHKESNGLNPEDVELLVTIRKRVGACMWKLKQAGHVQEVQTAGDLKAWVLSN